MVNSCVRGFSITLGSVLMILLGLMCNYFVALSLPIACVPFTPFADFSFTFPFPFPSTSLQAHNLYFPSTSPYLSLSVHLIPFANFSLTFPYTSPSLSLSVYFISCAYFSFSFPYTSPSLSLSVYFISCAYFSFSFPHRSPSLSLSFPFTPFAYFSFTFPYSTSPSLSLFPFSPLHFSFVPVPSFRSSFFFLSHHLPFSSYFPSLFLSLYSLPSESVE
jgi:hypothetical protein